MTALADVQRLSQSLSRRIHVLLVVAVTIWYLGSTYLPQAVGSCLEGPCSPTPLRVALSLLIPLAMACVPLLIEVLIFRRTWSQALRDIGITRWHRGGFPLALLYLLPLLAFYPFLAAATGQTLALQAGWPGRAAALVLNNGINEETMMRGFVFRRLRQDRPFWNAAALSTVYFAAYHVPLILTAGALVGMIGVLIAIPTGLLLACIYERGDRTIWASALAHAGTNAAPMLFILAPEQQGLATSLYLGTSILVSTALLSGLKAREQASIGAPAAVAPSGAQP
jgi:membrane protease YdiL (CAAX protease family)